MNRQDTKILENNLCLTSMPPFPVGVSYSSGKMSLSILSLI